MAAPGPARVKRRRRPPAPRWLTPLPEGAVGSWGPAVARFAERELGITLDLWQRWALNRALAYGADGRLLHRVYLISTARQNGKTALVRALIGWALTFLEGPEWHTILGLAHEREQARIPYKAVLEDLAPMRRRLGPIGRGGLALTMYLGIRSAIGGLNREYVIGSREARDSIRGYSTDLGLFDEVRTQRDFETWSALEPTTTARPNPLIVAISTAPDDRGVLLRGWWERGKRIIEGAEPAQGFGMAWWAAPDDLRPDDPRAIRAANPSVAEGRLELDVIRASAFSLGGYDSPAFRRERLNLPTEGGEEWLPAGLWRARATDQPEASDRVVLAVEAVPSWRRATVTVAFRTDAGAWVGVAGELDSSSMGASSIAPEELAALLERLIGAYHPAAIAYSATAAAAPYARAVAARARVPAIELGPRQLRAASQLFRSELIGNRLGHAADELLELQSRLVRPSGPLEAGEWYLSIRESLGEVDGIRAAAWAAWAAIAPPELEVAPQVFV